LFQIINIESEEKTNIIVQTVTISEFEGAQTGSLIVSYHVLPAFAKYETAEAVMIAKRGMKKKFGLICNNSAYPNIIYRQGNKKRKVY
jgi:hypothetical protein